MGRWLVVVVLGALLGGASVLWAQAPQGQAVARPRASQAVAPAPFRLTQQEFQMLWGVLKAWEKRAQEIKTFRADFTLWRYDPNFHPNRPAIYRGELRYKAPDKGMYRYRQNPNQPWLEDWSCDGQAIYRLDHQRKRLVVYPLPPQMRGRAIAQGPLPFVLGSDAQSLLGRYYMRLISPPAGREKEEIWLEAYPKHQRDRADFLRARVIFRRRDMLPWAVELTLPDGKSRDVYRFENVKINGGFLERLFGQETFTPRLPRGWTRVVDPGPQSGSQQAQSVPGTPARR